MNTLQKKTMSILLTSAMLLPLAGCKKGKGGLLGGDGVKTAPETIVDNSSTYYDAKISELVLKTDPDKTLSYVDVGQPVFAGDKVFTNYNVNYKMPTEVINEVSKLDYEDPDDYKKIMDIYNQYADSGVAIFDMDGNMIDTLDLEDNEYIYTISQNKAGEVYAVIEHGSDGPCSPDGSFDLCKIDPNGTISQKTSLKGIDEVGNSMIFTDEGDLFLYGYGGYTLVDKTGKIVFTKQMDDMATMFMENGKYYVMTYEYDPNDGLNSSIQEVRLSDGELIGDKIPLDSNYAYNLSQGRDGTYMTDGNGLKKVNLLENTSETVLNWNDADFNYSGIVTASTDIVSENEINLVRRSYNDTQDSYTVHTYIIHLTKSDTNPHAGQKVITIGGFGELNEAFLDCIVAYNRDTSHLAKINVADYTSLVDGSDSKDTMKQNAELSDKVYLELLGGTGPDILVDFSEFSQFNSENVLVNLNNYLDGSNGLNRSEYFDNVFHAFETNGKLFQIPVCFDIRGLMVNTDLVGERTGWTYDEFMQIASSLPQDTKIISGMTQEDLLAELLSQATSRLIDYEKGTVNFDSDEFKKILEIAKTYGEKELSKDGVAPDYAQVGNFSEADLFEEGLIASNPCYMYQLGAYANNIAVIKDKIGFSGFPGAEAVGLSAAPMMTLAIAATSPSQDEAWDFIKFMFDHAQQETFSNSFYSIPVSRQAFDNICRYEVEAYEERKAEFEKFDSKQAEKFYENPITMDMIDGYRAIVEQVSTIRSNDPAILAIIDEEAAAYFADQRSAEDVCKNIQNRATTIVNERG